MFVNAIWSEDTSGAGQHERRRVEIPDGAWAWRFTYHENDQGPLVMHDDTISFEVFGPASWDAHIQGSWCEVLLKSATRVDQDLGRKEDPHGDQTIVHMRLKALSGRLATTGFQLNQRQ